MKTIKIGSIGLGRLGYEHAKNLATAVPGVQLAAVCDIDAARVAQVREELDVPFGYTDFEEMCRNPELDAIAIVSPSDLHVEHIRIAMENGKHVFCEKPLATTVEACQEAEAIVNAHPGLVFMLGFMRRFDKSYLEAKKKVDNGDIGKIILVRSYNQDSVATIESTLKFAPHSGGQFLDMSVHEIDLIRWFTGSEIKNLWGIGGVFAYDLYRELNDGDNVAAMVQCENEAMGFMFLGRAAAQARMWKPRLSARRGRCALRRCPRLPILRL